MASALVAKVGLLGASGGRAEWQFGAEGCRGPANKDPAGALSLTGQAGGTASGGNWGGWCVCGCVCVCEAVTHLLRTWLRHTSCYEKLDQTAALWSQGVLNHKVSLSLLPLTAHSGDFTQSSFQHTNQNTLTIIFNTSITAVITVRQNA